MIEFFLDIYLGLCGEHFHPNVWTMMSSPLIVATVHWIKCKCGGWFTHKKDCKNLDNPK